jgi:ABC-type xylose transport system permease subunit
MATDMSALVRMRTAPNKQTLLTALPSVLLIVLVLAISVRQPTFLGPMSLRTLAESTAPIALLALGQSLVILTGGIDLSVAVLASLGTVLLATWIDSFGVLAIVMMVVVITGAGLLSGFITAYAQVPSFVVTLGAMGLWSGVALAVSGASTISIGPNYSLIGWLTSVRVGGVALSVYLALVLAVAIALHRSCRERCTHVGPADAARAHAGICRFGLLCGTGGGGPHLVAVQRRPDARRRPHVARGRGRRGRWQRNHRRDRWADKDAHRRSGHWRAACRHEHPWR